MIGPRRALGVAVIAMLTSALACIRPEDPLDAEADAKQQAHAPAEQVDRCHALAQIYCKNGPVSCEQVDEVLSKFAVPEDACAAAAIELEALIAELDDSQSYMVSTVIGRHLTTVLLESGSLNEDQRAQLEAIATRTSPSADAPTDVDRMDVTCPGVSKAVGGMPPAGTGRWCEREDGRRHGPAYTWNSTGELLRSIDYRNGDAIHVRFSMPQSQLLPPDLFMCPFEASERREGSGATQRRWCESKAGERHGPELVWEDGRLVMVMNYVSGQVREITHAPKRASERGND